MAGGLCVEPARKADGQAALARQLLRVDVDAGSRDVAFGAGVEHLVDIERLDDVGFEEVERYVFVFGVFRRYAELVECRDVVAVAQATDEDVLHAVLLRDACHFRHDGLCVRGSLAAHLAGAHLLHGDDRVALHGERYVLALLVPAAHNGGVVQRDVAGFELHAEREEAVGTKADGVDHLGEIAEIIDRDGVGSGGKVFEPESADGVREHHLILGACHADDGADERFVRRLVDDDASDVFVRQCRQGDG